LTRRWGPNDLEAARRVVSTAERDALDQAEQLRQEAEALLQASVQQRAAEELKAREQVASEVDGLRAELDQVSTRAAEAEAELHRLQAEWEHNGRPDRAGWPVDPGRAEYPVDPGLAQYPVDTGLAEHPPDSGAVEEAAPPALTLVPESRTPTDANYLADFVARMSSEAERLVEAAQAATRTTSDQASAETDRLLKAALAAIERDTAAAANLVAEAENERRAAEELGRQVEREHRAATVLREEAQNQLSEARAEVERILGEACAARDAQVAVRQELGPEMVALRKAMDVVRESLNRFLNNGGPAREAIDLRELADHGQRQRPI
jgi:DNA repair exonuclease SbcCD ATPase subunit